LQEGFPDWIAAIFGFCGAALFVANAPERGLDGEKIVTALLSLCLVSIASATKPIYGLLVIAILISTIADAARYLRRPDRRNFNIAAIGVVAVFVTAYAINYSYVAARSLPNYPVTEMSERLTRAAALLNSNFTIVFRILAFAGFALSPFLPRIRWLALPLGIGFWLWANTASYDLRNVLGLLLICVSLPFFAVARRLATTGVNLNERRWNIPDGAAAVTVAALCLALTLPLAMGDSNLKQRFADEQMSKGLEIELNRPIGEMLRRGCTVFSADGYINTISAFEPFRSQMRFFYFNEPLTDLLGKQLAESTGCTGIMYPPGRTHPTILNLIAALRDARGYIEVVEHKGMELLVSGMKPSDFQ
jgi:hypothetical protein